MENYNAEHTKTEEECLAAYAEYDVGALSPHLDIPSVLSSDASYEWLVGEKGRHLLKYDGVIYNGKADFLAAMFEHYAENTYNVKYHTDDVFRLSGSQRARLTYHILDEKIGSIPISPKDDYLLNDIARSGNHESARRWLGRMNWKHGNAKLITFGAGLEVKGTISGVCCYRPEYFDSKAVFTTVDMSWELWSKNIIAALDNKCVDVKDAFIAMYYQNGAYLTLPKTEMDQITTWILNYEFDTEFPYSGKIERGESFEIVFDRDCEIVKSKSLRHNGNMAAHNKENAAELAAARGKVQTSKAALRDYELLTGDEWTTKELNALGLDARKIKRLVDAGLIWRVTQGLYRRV